MDRQLLLLPDRDGDAQRAPASDKTRGESVGKNNCSSSRAGKIDQRASLEKLRKRAPRQAELLEAISNLKEPTRAADLLRQNFSRQSNAARAGETRSGRGCARKQSCAIRMATSSLFGRQVSIERRTDSRTEGNHTGASTLPKTHDRFCSMG